MASNREESLLGEALARVKRIGRGLCVAFVLAAVLSLAFAVFCLLGIVISGVGQLAAFQVGGLVYSAIQSLVMLTVYSLCALVAYDASRGMTPFSDRQIRRIVAAACVMAVFTLMCLVWDPLVYEFSLAYGDVSVGIDASVSSNTYFVNFGALVAAGTLFLFAFVMVYGKTLQQFSDETL